MPGSPWVISWASVSVAVSTCAKWRQDRTAALPAGVQPVFPPIQREPSRKARLFSRASFVMMRTLPGWTASGGTTSGACSVSDFVVTDAERWEIRKLAVELCLIQRVGAGRIVGVRHSQTPLADVSQIWIERHARHEPSVADWIVDDSRIRNDCKEVE